MPKPATAIVLSDQERETLEQVKKRHRSEQQMVLRARIILAAASGQSNASIARDLHITVETARLWRDRWASVPQAEGKPLSVLQRLQEAPRPGAAPKCTVEQRCQMAVLACEAPQKSGRPLSQWTGREIADELIARGVVESISPRHAARLLKKGASNLTVFGIG